METHSVPSYLPHAKTLPESPVWTLGAVADQTFYIQEGILKPGGVQGRRQLPPPPHGAEAQAPTSPASRHSRGFDLVFYILFVCVSMCVCIIVCIPMHVCVHVRMYVYACMCTYICVRMCKHIVCICMRVCVCSYVCVCVYAKVCEWWSEANLWESVCSELNSGHQAWWQAPLPAEPSQWSL